MLILRKKMLYRPKVCCVPSVSFISNTFSLLRECALYVMNNLQMLYTENPPAVFLFWGKFNHRLKYALTCLRTLIFSLWLPSTDVSSDFKRPANISTSSWFVIQMDFDICFILLLQNYNFTCGFVWI
jgi:hypothetical protein